MKLYPAILAIALCASLSACSQQQVDSAGTIALITADSVYANGRAYELFQLNSHKVTQQQFDEWDANAQFLRDQTKANILTLQQLQAALNPVAP